MAKSKSKKPGKAHAVAPVVSGKTPKKASVPRGVRKHLRQLERQLSDAARQERKRLRKLDRATFRRQMLQAALEELRGETAIAAATLAEPTLAPESSSPPESAAPITATVAKAPRAKTGTAGAAAKRPAAKRRRTTGDTKTTD
jgi:hypothetical protein